MKKTEEPGPGITRGGRVIQLALPRVTHPTAKQKRTIAIASRQRDVVSLHLEDSDA